MRYKLRSNMRRRVSKYSMRERKLIRNRIKTGVPNPDGKYSKILHYNNKLQSKTTKKPRRWFRTKSSKTIKKLTKSKTLRVGLVTATAVGTLLTVLPKESLGSLAEVVQKTGETIYDMAENMGDTAGGLVRVSGSLTDGLSNGIAFVAENFNTLIAVGIGGWFLTR